MLHISSMDVDRGVCLYFPLLKITISSIVLLKFSNRLFSGHHSSILSISFRHLHSLVKTQLKLVASSAYFTTEHSPYQRMESWVYRMNRKGQKTLGSSSVENQSRGGVTADLDCLKTVCEEDQYPVVECDTQAQSVFMGKTVLNAQLKSTYSFPMSGV